MQKDSSSIISLRKKHELFISQVLMFRCQIRRCVLWLHLVFSTLRIFVDKLSFSLIFNQVSVQLDPDMSYLKL